MMHNNNTSHPGSHQWHPISHPPETFSAMSSTSSQTPPFRSTPGSPLRPDQGQGWQAPPLPPGPAPGQSSPLSSSSSRGTSRPLGGKKLAAIVISGICLVTLLGVGGFVWLLGKGKSDVTLYQVGVHNVNQYVGGGGIVFPRQQLDISYPVAERVVAVLVKAGDQVSVNQSLIQLDPSQLNAQIKQAADDLDAAQAYLNSVSTSGNALQIAQAQQAYNVAKNKYNALVAQATSPLLNKGNLISPMNGVVTSIHINPGEVFPADTVLLTIMDESTVIVHVKVPLANLAQVHIGQSAVVTPSALPNLDFNGTVSAVIPQADPQTDTFEVWINVANPDKALLPGMSAFVHIQSSGKAFLVPHLAVLNVDRESMVFVVRNDHAYMQHVHVIGRSIDSIYVDTGLSANDKVVLVGAYLLQNGQKVRVTRVER